MRRFSDPTAACAKFDEKRRRLEKEPKIKEKKLFSSWLVNAFFSFPTADQVASLLEDQV